MLIILAAILILVSAVLLWLSARQKHSTGIPAGRVIYTDTDNWGKVEKPLYDALNGISGKPDYIIEKDGLWIPVEVKSSPAPVTPYDNHVYQLTAYCLLVEQTYGVRPPYGILRYRNRTIEIEYTNELKHGLLELLEKMRLQENLRKGPVRSHEYVGRCMGCGFRETCDQSLEGKTA
jgi:CRISPR-associated exonuclease Cas4